MIYIVLSLTANELVFSMQVNAGFVMHSEALTGHSAVPLLNEVPHFEATHGYSYT
jgi:hypothetical protein